MRFLEWSSMAFKSQQSERWRSKSNGEHATNGALHVKKMRRCAIGDVMTRLASVLIECTNMYMRSHESSNICDL
jgi:hypothetical protein